MKKKQGEQVPTILILRVHHMIFNMKKGVTEGMHLSSVESLALIVVFMMESFLVSLVLNV